MNLIRLGCLSILFMLSTPSHALIDGYYSQAVDIDYALQGEDEPIRVTLKRAIKKILDLVKINSDESSMSISLNYIINEEDLASTN